MPRNLLLLLVVACTQSTAYLSLDWAKKQMQQSEAERKISLDRAREKAAILHQEGQGLYRKREDQAALEKYEEALDHLPSAEIYFDYGNSLTSLKRYGDAIQAYQISIELGYAKPQLSFYNMACAYSLDGNLLKSKESLEQAFAKGYSNWGHMKADPDLANLRQSGYWISVLKMIGDPAGLLRWQSYDSEGVSIFCSNGQYRQWSGGAFFAGMYERAGKDLQIRITRICSTERIETPIPSTGPGQAVAGPATPPAVLCTDLDEAAGAERNRIESDIIASEFERALQPFDDRDPLHCDLTYRPKTVQDLFSVRSLVFH